jgi:hypothetical protein
MLRGSVSGWSAAALGIATCLACSVYGSQGVLSSAGSSVSSPSTPEYPLAESNDLTSQLKVLFAQWKAIPGVEWSAKSGPIRNQVDAALSMYVARRLNDSPRPSALELQQEVNTALVEAVWESVFGLSPAAVGSTHPTFAWVVQGGGSASDLYVASFAVGYGNVFSVSLHGFASLDGKYAPAGAAGHELDSSTPQVIRLQSFSPHELRILAWGLHIGSPEGLTSLALYSFDGHELRVLWNEDGVPQAKVRLLNNRLMIETERASSLKNETWEHEQALYEQVPSGLKLLKTKRWTTK